LFISNRLPEKVIQNIANELENQIGQMKSNQTAFHIKHSPIVLFLEEPPYARIVVLADDSPCTEIFQYIDKKEDGEMMGKKRKVKQKEFRKVWLLCPFRDCNNSGTQGVNMKHVEYALGTNS
jgi:hypothetical protein